MGSKSKKTKPKSGFKDIQGSRKRLINLSKDFNILNDIAKYSALVNEIEYFLNICEEVIRNESVSLKPKYAVSTLDKIENWAEEWETMKEKLLKNKSSKIATRFFAIGKFFMIRKRRDYSEKDLPILPPANYKPSKNIYSTNELYRDYSEKDLPEYTSG